MAGEEGSRRVVVGVHGSASSRAALRWAAREARLREAPLHVIRVWEDPARGLAPYAAGGGPALAGESRAAAAAGVAALVHEVLGPCPPGRVVVQLADGLAARVLLERAVDAGLLVIGAGTGAVTHDIGPVAHAVLRHAPCPVTLVAPEPRASAARRPHADRPGPARSRRPASVAKGP